MKDAKEDERQGRERVQKTQTPLPVVGQRRLIDSLVVPQVAGRL